MLGKITSNKTHEENRQTLKKINSFGNYSTSTDGCKTIQKGRLTNCTSLNSFFECAHTYTMDNIAIKNFPTTLHLTSATIEQD